MAEKHKLIEYANGPSLQEINGTVDVPRDKGFFKTLFAYSGPGALVAVGYMDPGNWSTSITGGQNFQYLLMSVILMSSLIAMLLQYMAAKLGIVSKMDLAQAIRARTSRSLGIVLWILTELAIMATDIAEVIGGAIALYLLFNIPLVIAVFITVGDVLVLLLLTKIGFRKIEAIVVCLILVILFVFVYQVALSNPDWGGVFAGLIPTGKTFSPSPSIGGQTPLTGALGIIGATVMPHNLYLHSAISQTRKVNHADEKSVAQNVRFSAWDSNIQLTAAFFVNALLLIMGVAVFKSGAVKDPSFFGLYQALSDTSTLSNGVLIAVAKSGVLSTLFAVALLASGQNSTITGTLTGQVIMEGFVHMRMPLWLRRLVTRLISVIPVLICVMLTSGKSAIDEHEALNTLMNNSQVFLAFALPFSMLPLLLMTDSATEMGNKFKNSTWIKGFGWLSVIALTFLNLYGLPGQIQAFYGDKLTGAQTMQANIIAYVLIAAVLALLVWTIVDMHKGNERLKNVLAKEDVTSTYEHLAKLSAAAGSEEEFDKEATAERNSEQR
ncbi:Nramp family divalent metal transporter [Companilactobacillus pabuli]|uniref:Divalent metal cation transporter MntH n=1 Tax=Companilactobacillus pabuli TaxID=2714036 RepID=A0A7L7KUI4_9LACO|nr:Nramp family divalent metal transporter [Companilactobacillus pabuli]AKP03240.1 manganese transporter [Companilactobacillus farciminis]AKS51540.1 manganese transporter [Companilactobacillus farciminis]QMT83315.1 divalent metal cation transporter [Companilactobacillus pabuli]GAQ02620.1 manganese transporter [Companilactobacillus farciminis]